MSWLWRTYALASMAWWAFFGGFAAHDAVVRNAPDAPVASVLAYMLFAASTSLWLTGLMGRDLFAADGEAL